MSRSLYGVMSHGVMVCMVKYRGGGAGADVDEDRQMNELTALLVHAALSPGKHLFLYVRSF